MSMAKSAAERHWPDALYGEYEMPDRNPWLPLAGELVEGVGDIGEVSGEELGSDGDDDDGGSGASEDGSVGLKMPVSCKVIFTAIMCGKGSHSSVCAICNVLWGVR